MAHIGRGVRAARGASLALVLALCCLLGLAAPAAARAAEEAAPTQAAHLAERLRENPVHISDLVPREVPRSAAPAFAREAGRAGVPTYVMVLPQAATGAFGDRLLAAVHDRLGRDGVYVLSDEDGISFTAEAYGVDVPAAAAARAASYETHYSAGALRTFRTFVDALTSGDAEGRAERAAERYVTGDEDPPTAYISTTDRANQGFLTGIAASGLPLTLLLTRWWLRRGARGRRLRARLASGGTARRVDLVKQRSAPAAPPSTASAAGRPGRALRSAVALGAALALSGGVLLGALAVFDETRSGPGPDPTAADMDARVDRVADALRTDPLHTEPEYRPVLGATQLAELRARLGTSKVPVRLAVVPSLSEDESGGSQELLAALLHRVLGQDAVYVLADPVRGYVHVANHGARLRDDALYDLPERVEWPEGTDRDAADRGLPNRLGLLLDHIEDTPAGPPGEPRYLPDPAPDPVDEDTLPPLLSGDFWPGLTLVGPVLAVTLGVVVVASVAVYQRHTAIVSAPAGGPERPDAPTRPSASWLRRTVRRELDAVSEEFEERREQLPSTLRSRVWECLDTAVLLADSDGDGRVDSDAAAPDLACALVLVRAARARLLSGEPRAGEVPCGLNPLHPPAAPGRRVGIGPGWHGSFALCAECRADVLASSHRRRTAEERVLRLPDPDTGASARHLDLDGNASLLRAGPVAIVVTVREALHVR